MNFQNSQRCIPWIFPVILILLLIPSVYKGCISSCTLRVFLKYFNKNKNLVNEKIDQTIVSNGENREFPALCRVLPLTFMVICR